MNKFKLLLIKILCGYPQGIKNLSRLLFIPALIKLFVSRKHHGSIINYKRKLGIKNGSLSFLFKYYLRRSFNALAGLLICEAPEKYYSYVEVEGEEFISAEEIRNNGTIVIGNHGAPMMLMTFIFTNKFNIPLGSFAFPETVKILKSRKPERERDRLVQSLPLYAFGEEKSLVRGLLNGEWVNMLMDVPFPPPHKKNISLFGKEFAFSEFPFKLALKYKISLFFVGITSSPDSGGKIKFRISPLAGFNTPAEGAEKYAEKLEYMLREDPFSNGEVPLWF